MPISSMTGFASTSGDAGEVGWRWDIKSVNARGLDLRVRVPHGYETLEPKLRNVAQKHLKRGSISIGLSIKPKKTFEKSGLDELALAEAVRGVAIIRAVLAEAGVPVAKTRAEALLSLPGVMAQDDGRDPIDIKSLFPSLLEGFETTIKALVVERNTEGARLDRVISEHVAQIESLTWDAAQCAGETVTILRERLTGQLATLLGDTALPPARMAQEAALLASKADVREEIDRLKAHVEAARALLATAEPVGRRLDFLTQEFNREANTLCSKSHAEQMTRIGLELKTVIDQMREQAANVE